MLMFRIRKPGYSSVRHTRSLYPVLAQSIDDDATAGEVAEQMNDLDFALTAYEHALRHNPRCVPALSQVAGIARIKENYHKVLNLISVAIRFLTFQQAIDYFQRVVNLPGHETNGDVWSALGTSLIYFFSVVTFHSLLGSRSLLSHAG
jgi:tetratricopeptide (TPR) repeat protein